MTEIDELKELNDVLIKALELIAGYKGKTLLGLDSADSHSFQLGANTAFEDLAAIADAALATARGK